MKKNIVSNTFMLVFMLSMIILFGTNIVMADPPAQDVNLAGYVYYPNASAVPANVEVFAYSSSGTSLGGTNTTSSGFYLIVVPAASATSGDNVTVNASPTGYYGEDIFYNIQGGDNGLHSINLTDILAPSVVSGFTATAVAAGEKLNLTWTANTDDTAGYLLFRGSTQIANISPKANNSYLDTSLTNGQLYTYKISAYDDAPNYAANATTTGTPADTLAPAQVTGAAVTSGNNTINLTWSAVTQNSDATSITDLAGYHVYWNNSGTWTLVSTTTSLYYNNGSLTNNQAYMYKVAAYDTTGNEGTNSTTVSGTPSERPTLSASPASGTTIKSSVIVNISITSGQTLDTVQYVVYNSTGATIDSGQTNTSVAVTTWTYNINPSSWAEGVGHSVYIFANDTNGQSSQQNFTYTTDDTKPTVSSAVISSALVKSTTTIQLNVTVTDASTISSVSAANGSSVSMGLLTGNIYSASTNASALGCSATDGACLVTFTATDTAGNINNSVTLSFNIDDIVPAVSSPAKNDSLVKGTDSLKINVTVTDTNTISGVTVSGGTAVAMTNISATIYSVTTNATALGCSDGTCTLTFAATDELGNVNDTVTTSVTVDDTKPAVTSPDTNDTDNIVKSTDSLNITVTVSDTNDVSSVTLNGTTMTQIGSTNVWTTVNTTTQFGCTSDGTCVLTFVATDTVGNVNNTVTLTLIVDDTAPVINITAPENASTKNNSYFTLAFNANETNPSATTFCNYTLVKNSTTTHSDLDVDASEMIQLGTIYSLSTTLTAVANGNYTLTVTCVDKLAQTSSLAYDFTVNDSVAPIVSTISASSEGRKPVTVTLSVTTNEAATCKYATADTNYTSMTNMTTTGGTTHSVANSYTTDTTGTYYVICSDVAENIMNTSSSVAFTADVRSSSGGGSGGTTTITPVIPTYTKVWTSVKKDASEKITINPSTYKEVPFTSLEFKPTKDLSSPEIKVVVLDAASSTTGTLKKKAYKYVEVKETNIEEGDLTATKIEFKVEKTWLTQNALTKEQIALFRYTNNIWVQQETVVSSEDSNFVYYSVATSGFSYFAIGEKEDVTPVATPVVTPPASSEPELQPPVTTPVNPPTTTGLEEPPMSEERLPSRRAAFWGFISLFVVIALLYIFWKEGKLQRLFKKQKEHEVHIPHTDFEKLDKFVREQLNEGHEPRHIRISLLEAGWKKEIIDDMLKKYKK